MVVTVKNKNGKVLCKLKMSEKEYVSSTSYEPFDHNLIDEALEKGYTDMYFESTSDAQEYFNFESGKIKHLISERIIVNTICDGWINQTFGLKQGNKTVVFDYSDVNDILEFLSITDLDSWEGNALVYDSPPEDLLIQDVVGWIQDENEYQGKDTIQILCASRDYNDNVFKYIDTPIENHDELNLLISKLQERKHYVNHVPQAFINLNGEFLKNHPSNRSKSKQKSK